jgi:hypothetical protein
MQTENLHPLRQFLAPRDQHSALTGRDVLGSVETEGRRSRVRSHLSAAVGCLDGMRRVLKHDEAMPIRQ